MPEYSDLVLEYDHPVIRPIIVLPDGSRKYMQELEATEKLGASTLEEIRQNRIQCLHGDGWKQC